jgi:hypothetical protein
VEKSSSRVRRGALGDVASIFGPGPELGLGSGLGPLMHSKASYPGPRFAIGGNSIAYVTSQPT